MGALAGIIEAHYRQQDRQEITVPEWEGEPYATLYVSPITLAQVAAINKETDPVLRCAKIVEVCAKDANGKRMFDDSDAAALRSWGVGKFGPTLLTRIAGDIMAVAGADTDIEDAEGN